MANANLQIDKAQPERRSPIDDDRIVSRAIRGYCEQLRREGLPPCQPSSALSRLENEVIILANARGELARYQLTPRGRLRRLKGASR